MTKTEMLTKAAELEAKADLLYSSLLGPSLKEQAYRDEAASLKEAAK